MESFIMKVKKKVLRQSNKEQDCHEGCQMQHMILPSICQLENGSSDAVHHSWLPASGN